MTITLEEQLARKLWALHEEALGYMDSVEHSWDGLTAVQREAWIQVAQFVEAMLENYILIYGYNGKEAYVGLDQYIKAPDHR